MDFGSQSQGIFYTLPRGKYPQTFVQHPWLPLLITALTALVKNDSRDLGLPGRDPRHVLETPSYQVPESTMVGVKPRDTMLGEREARRLRWVWTCRTRSILSNDERGRWLNCVQCQ